MVLNTKKEDVDNVQVTFEASNHSISILAGLKHLREKEQLFDVILLVGGHRFPAHRVVLASCCDYFRAMFTDGLMECQQSEVHLNGVTANGIKHLIDFAYSSKIHLDFDNIEDVLSSANHIQMIPVVEACINFLKTHISIENCVNMACLADLFSLPDIKAFIYRYMCSNFEAFALSLEFCKLSPKHLCHLLESDYPVNCSEADVLSAVLNWIDHSFVDRVIVSAEVLPKVHISRIKKSEIEKLPNSHILDKVLEIQPNLESLFQGRKSSICDRLLQTGLINCRGYEEAIVCIGGFSSNGGMTNEIRYLQTNANTWQHLSEIPHVYQCNFGMCVLRNHLYVAGGCFNEQMQEVIHPYGFRYNPQLDIWDSISPMTMERCRFYLGALGNKLYAIGGDSTTMSDDFLHSAPCECYDPEKDCWTQIAPLPGNRSQHAGITLNNFLYISGGLEDLDDGILSSFYKYDQENDTWIELSSMLHPRADHAMYIYQGKIHAVGGWFNDSVTQQRTMATTIDCYIEEEDRWEVVADMHLPRLFATYTVFGDCLYGIGGWMNGDNQSKAQTVEMFNLVTGKCKENKAAPLEIWEHSACCLYVPRHKT